MNMHSGKKVYVVLAKTHAKIWKEDFEPHATPIIIEGPHMGHEKKKLIDRVLNGRIKAPINPHFASMIAQEIKGFDQIYLAGGGKGKASTVGNFTTYLRKFEPQMADRIRRVEDINAEGMTEAQLLAVAREMITHL